MDTQDHIDLARRHRTTGNSVVASMELLVEIRDLLRAQAGAPPSMPVVVPAARPGVEDDSVRRGVNGLITFTCDVKPSDSISIDSNYVNTFTRRLFIDFDVADEGDKSVGLSVEDARKFANAILREVGEG